MNWRRVLPVTGFFVFWEMVVRLGFVKPYLLSPFTVAVATLLELLFTGEFLKHIGYSMYRALAGFALAALMAIPLGIAMGWSKKADDLASPLVELFRPLPTVALIPVAILWLGIGNTSKIALIAYACFFSILLNTIGGVKGIDGTLIKTARSMGATDGQVLRRVVFPGALPSILVGLRIALAVSLIVMIVMEMVGSAWGIGFFIYNAKLTFRTEEMYAGILAIGIIGFLLNEVIMQVTRRLLVWRPEIFND